MEPSRFAEADLSVEDRTALLDLAEQAIRAALERRAPPIPDVDALPAPLRRPGGVFVTLLVHGALNGCIGNIRSTEPIGRSVPRLAVESAFHDPRLPPLRRGDLDDLEIEISLLSPLHPIPAGSRDQVLARIRPGVDGLLIGSGNRSAVFLPTVWQQLPEPDRFVDQLLRKGGFHVREWPSDMTADVFTTAVFARTVAPRA